MTYPLLNPYCPAGELLDTIMASVQDQLPIRNIVNIIVGYAKFQRSLAGLTQVGDFTILGNSKPIKRIPAKRKGLHQKGLISHVISVGKYILINNYSSRCFILKVNSSKIKQLNNSNILKDISQWMSAESFKDHEAQSLDIDEGVEAGFVAIPGTSGNVLAVTTTRTGVNIVVPAVSSSSAAEESESESTNKELKLQLQEVLTFGKTKYQSATLGVDENVDKVYLFTTMLSTPEMFQVQQFDHVTNHILPEFTRSFRVPNLNFFRFVTFVPQWRGFILRGVTLNYASFITLFYSVDDAGTVLDLSEHIPVHSTIQNDIVVTDNYLVVTQPMYSVAIKYINLSVYQSAYDVFKVYPANLIKWEVYKLPMKLNLFTHQNI